MYNFLYANISPTNDNTFLQRHQQSITKIHASPDFVTLCWRHKTLPDIALFSNVCRLMSSLWGGY